MKTLKPFLLILGTVLMAASTCFGQDAPALTANTITLAAPASVTEGVRVVVDGQFDGRCPVCKAQGKKSRVEPGHRTSTLAMPYSYYDEQGALHSGRDTNTTTSRYSCSNGHSFTTMSKRGEGEWVVAPKQPVGGGFLAAPRKKKPQRRKAHASVQPQQIDQTCIGNFCINATGLPLPAVIVTPPTRAGKLALVSDIVAGPAPTQAPEAKGIITLANGGGSATLTGFTVIPICVVSDPSGNSVRYANTATVLTVSGVGPNVAFICR